MQLLMKPTTAYYVQYSDDRPSLQTFSNVLAKIPHANADHIPKRKSPPPAPIQCCIT